MSQRVMAVVRWAILVAVTAVAAFSVWRYWGPGSASIPSHREDRFYCPMHPQITSDVPGECPICHMDLELIPEPSVVASSTPTASGASAPREPSTTPVASTVPTKRSASETSASTSLEST